MLRYGENPHQRAALYTSGFAPEGGLAQATQLHGKEMSYNNYVDADAARRAAYDFDRPAVAIIKHANPCGIAVGADVAEAHRKAHACDPVSAFGGVIATNVPVVGRDGRAGRGDLHRGRRRARATTTARSRCSPRKKNIRLLECAPADARRRRDPRRSPAACCMQARDAVDADGRRRRRRPVDLDAGHRRAGLRASELADLAFAWRACRAVKSNAILLASDGASVGVGMGQVNRVDSCRLAVERAGERAAGSVAASRRVLPVRRRAADPRRRRRRGDRPARRLGARRGGRRGR